MEREDGIPRRDLVLIPLIAVVTAVVLLCAAELISMQFFDERQDGNCGVADPVLGHRNAPNCHYRNKAAEGPMVDYNFNECGYRSTESCRTKVPDSVRIALLGASTAEGFKIGYDDALAPRAAAELTRRCRRPVEFQNMGVAGYKIIDQYLRVDEALALRPDLAVLVITPYELVDQTDPVMMENRHHPERLTKPATDGEGGGNNAGLLSRVSALLSRSHAALAAQYLLFQNRTKYIDLFLMHGDKADYLRQPLSAAWEKRLVDLDLLLGEMADRFKDANVPFLILFTPQRIQVALSQAGNWPPGVDPTAIATLVEQICRKHGIGFLNSYDDFRQVEGSERLFLPVDGHMTAGGHALVANQLVRGLLQSGLPAFATCTSPDSAPQ